MSAGVLRKQNEALEGLIAGFGVSFPTPEGSFNEKFCELCRLAIENFGGAFTPIQGGSFLTRKAYYFQQLVEALNITVPRGKTAHETFLNSAFALWQTENNGTAPDRGSSFDWRIYQFIANAQVGGKIEINAEGKPSRDVHGNLIYIN